MRLPFSAAEAVSSHANDALRACAEELIILDLIRSAKLCFWSHKDLKIADFNYIFLLFINSFDVIHVLERSSWCSPQLGFCLSCKKEYLYAIICIV